jgi:DNA mismatch endonuclease, patch repair protein
MRSTVDIVFPTQQLAVFVDGCFWHGCPEHGNAPRTNAEWWASKLERNKALDAEDVSTLTQAGWSVLRVWEHEQIEEAVARVEARLRCL